MELKIGIHFVQGLPENCKDIPSQVQVTPGDCYFKLSISVSIKLKRGPDFQRRQVQ